MILAIIVHIYVITLEELVEGAYKNIFMLVMIRKVSYK